MFKIPNGIPTLRTSSQEWADYAEYKALKSGNIALLDLIKAPLMVSDEITLNGIEDETDRYINKADEIAHELKRRNSYTNNKYPYLLENSAYSLKYVQSDSYFNLVYRFLLLSTRLNMKSDKIQNGLDGTRLFENLSAEIASSFFGKNACVDVLGTSKTNVGGFRKKLSTIFQKIGEGGKIHENEALRPQDDNIDVIVWKGFSDKQVSQMVAFGQCKTGTNWQNNLSELNVEAFCKTWFSEQPVLTPVRMFFCTQYFPSEIWRPRAYEAGLVFDRFRIIDYLPEFLNEELLESLASWCASAENQYPL